MLCSINVSSEGVHVNPVVHTSEMFNCFAQVAEIDNPANGRSVTTDSVIGMEGCATDQQTVLLRKLRDVVINARGTKIYAHRALLVEDEFFAKMLSSKKKEYRTNEDPDKIKKHIERIYFGESSSPPLDGLATNGPDKNKCEPTEVAEPESKEFTFEKSITINEFPLNEAMDLDKSLIKHFESEHSHTHHTYLLLDPFISKDFGSGNSVAVQIFNAFFKFSKLTRDNFYRIAIEQVNLELFRRFVSSIFYVGAQHNDRLSGSLLEDCTNAAKNEKILKIIHEGKGPVQVVGFTGISQKEAACRVSLMVQAIGAHNLTNDEVTNKCTDLDQDQNKRILMGTYLLLKSFLKFVANGQKQWQQPATSKQEHLLNSIVNE